jgi:hypothetical protein
LLVAFELIIDNARDEQHKVIKLPTVVFSPYLCYILSLKSLYSPSTLFHILNRCPSSGRQNRFHIHNNNSLNITFLYLRGQIIIQELRRQMIMNWYNASFRKFWALLGPPRRKNSSFRNIKTSPNYNKSVFTEIYLLSKTVLYTASSFRMNIIITFDFRTVLNKQLSKLPWYDFSFVNFLSDKNIL